MIVVVGRGELRRLNNGKEAVRRVVAVVRRQNGTEALVGATQADEPDRGVVVDGCRTDIGGALETDT